MTPRTHRFNAVPDKKNGIFRPAPLLLTKTLRSTDTVYSFFQMLAVKRRLVLRILVYLSEKHHFRQALLTLQSAPCEPS